MLPTLYCVTCGRPHMDALSATVTACAGCGGTSFQSWKPERVQPQIVRWADAYGFLNAGPSPVH